MSQTASLTADPDKKKIGTLQKALEVNLEYSKYGTFAEIGAGQEVVRWFFQAGAAAGTIAKSISAYDMTVSDAIYGHSKRYVSRQRLEKMLDYPWPGNVRELENEIERLMVLAADDKTITPEILNQRILDHGDSHHGGEGHGPGLKGVNTNGSLKEALEELEIHMIREGLKRCGFNKSRLAKELGISRAGLIMKVEKYGLDKRQLKRVVGE